jgi:hypothetical protein
MRWGRPDPAERTARGLELVDFGAGGGLVGVPDRVDGGVVGPLRRQGLLREDRIDRTLRLARAAVDALVRIDEQLPIRTFFVMDAVDGADRNARDVEHVDARLGDHVGHRVLLAWLGGFARSQWTEPERTTERRPSVVTATVATSASRRTHPP